MQLVLDHGHVKAELDGFSDVPEQERDFRVGMDTAGTDSGR